MAVRLRAIQGVFDKEREQVVRNLEDGVTGTHPAMLGW